MRQVTKNPDIFAAEFNHKVQGAHRKVDAVDIRYMTECGFIKRYIGYNMRLDIETVRRLLLLEHLQRNRQKREEIKDDNGDKHCRLCRVVLTDKHKGESGRPKEYCDDCEPVRSKERNREWWERKRAVRE